MTSIYNKLWNKQECLDTGLGRACYTVRYQYHRIIGESIARIFIISIIRGEECKSVSLNTAEQVKAHNSE